MFLTKDLIIDNMNSVCMLSTYTKGNFVISVETQLGMFAYFSQKSLHVTQTYANLKDGMQIVDLVRIGFKLL